MCSQVSRGFYVAARDEEIWRLVIYIPAHRSAGDSTWQPGTRRSGGELYTSLLTGLQGILRGSQGRGDLEVSYIHPCSQVSRGFYVAARDEEADRALDPPPDPSIIKQNIRKNLCFSTVL